MPLSSTQDIAGPLARSVTDLATMLDATVGADPTDAITKDNAPHIPRSYREALAGATLKGARIGVLKALWGNAPEDDEVAGVLTKALDGFKAQGAEVVDISVPGLDDLLRDSSVIADEFKFDLMAYLARQPNAPVKSLSEILDRGLYHAELEQTFRLRNAPEKRENEHYRQAMVKRRALRAAVMATLEEQRIDALAYPTLRRKPAIIGEAQGGTNCQLSATTGLPAMSIPAGFSVDGLPVGLELLAGEWQESKLLRYAYAWEQAARPRKAPFSTPALVKGSAPAPRTQQFAIGAATVAFTYDETTGSLRYEIATKLPATDRVLAMTLQRTDGDRPGAIVAHLLRPNQVTGQGTMTLRGRTREELAAGRLYLHFYTKQAPLGVERQRVAF